MKFTEWEDKIKASYHKLSPDFIKFTLEQAEKNAEGLDRSINMIIQKCFWLYWIIFTLIGILIVGFTAIDTDGQTILEWLLTSHNLPILATPCVLIASLWYTARVALIEKTPLPGTRPSIVLNDKLFEDKYNKWQNQIGQVNRIIDLQEEIRRLNGINDEKAKNFKKAFNMLFFAPIITVVAIVLRTALVAA